MATGNPTITGYYRFTDIIFEWHRALPNQDDFRPLKAMISYDALVHPDHPLRKEGIDGIEMFIGTFENGEARLLFSSAQIEYIRYYIHAMGLTKQLIPIPSSDYLITQSSLSSCSPSVYNDAASLKKANKDVEKNNSRLKSTGTRLTARRLAFERVRTYWSSKKGTWLAIDFETWDRDHTIYTEFGWCSLRFEDGKEVQEDGHLAVKEHNHYRNTYVPDQRDRYNFGKSEPVNKKGFKERIGALINECKERGPVFLVFHNASQDVKSLRSPQVDAPVLNLSFVLPDVTPNDGLYVIDTAELFAALEGEVGANTRGLLQVARHLGFNPTDLHNAGNDAHYTLQACKAMASGDPVDVQRVKRWPEYVSQTQPKVVWNEDQDEEDTEDIM